MALASPPDETAFSAFKKLSNFMNGVVICKINTPRRNDIQINWYYIVDYCSDRLGNGPAELLAVIRFLQKAPCTELYQFVSRSFLMKA